MPALRSVLETGLDFVEFLGERKSKTDRKELKDIYNLEFKRCLNRSVMLLAWQARLC